MRTRKGAVVGAAAAVVAALAAFASPAAAWYTPNLTIQYKHDDAFRNYDFESPDVSAYNVDWPVDFIFYNNAAIDKVKYQIGWGAWGNPMYGRLNDGYGWVWDDDRGRKSSWDCYGSTVNHYRLYADGDDRLYNPSWGFWVFATAHRDYNECGGGEKYSGNSEYTEHLLANAARNAYGWANVGEDANWHANYEPSRFVGSHWWWNDGYGSYAFVR